MHQSDHVLVIPQKSVTWLLVGLPQTMRLNSWLSAQVSHWRQASMLGSSSKEGYHSKPMYQLTHAFMYLHGILLLWIQAVTNTAKRNLRILAACLNYKQIVRKAMQLDLSIGVCM